MKKQQQPEKAPNHERWLLTYADLITLLLTFFIVLYSMSSVDAGRYKVLSESVKVALGNNSGNISPFEGGSITPFQESQDFHDNPNQNTEPMQKKIEEYTIEQEQKAITDFIEKNQLGNAMETQIEERGLTVRLSDSMIFDAGQAEIKPAAIIKLIALGKLLNKVSNYLRIEGHSDNLPIHTLFYNSNWQLSGARATNIVELLIRQANVAPQRISGVAYGEYRPIASNTTAIGRQKNRRVDIVIMSTKYSGMEIVK